MRKLHRPCAMLPCTNFLPCGKCQTSKKQLRNRLAQSSGQASASSKFASPHHRGAMSTLWTPCRESWRRGAGNWQGPLCFGMLLFCPSTSTEFKVPAEPGEHPLGLCESGRSDSRFLNHRRIFRALSEGGIKTQASSWRRPCGGR